MNMYGAIDFGAFFGAEVRVLEGEDYLCIPMRYNPSVRMIDRRPIALIRLVELPAPDKDGNTHDIRPYIPRAISQNLAQADFERMTRSLGRVKAVALREQAPAPEQNPKLDHSTLAVRAVREDDIQI